MATRSTSASRPTCYVVAYDIPDDRRRTKVHQILLGFGKWTQYSLFECFLSRKDLILLQAKLDAYLSETQDSVRFYPLCASSSRKWKPLVDRHQRMTFFLLCKLSREARSDGIATLRASRFSRSSFSAKSLFSCPDLQAQKEFKKRVPRNSLPFLASGATLQAQQAKWPAEPVRV